MLSLQTNSNTQDWTARRMYHLLHRGARTLCRPGRLTFIAVLLFTSGAWVLLYGQGTSGFTKVNTSPVTTTSFTSGTLLNGATYNVEVTAVNAAGESGPSTIVSGTVPTSGTHTFTLSWTASTGAVSYNVYDQVVTIPNPPGAPTLVIN